MIRLFGFFRGATLADLFLLLGAVGLFAALLSPSWDARSFRARVAQAIADVDSLAASARSARHSTGLWPQPGVNEPPAGPSDAPAGPPSAPGGYAVAWTIWEVVDDVETPADAGASAGPATTPSGSLGPPPSPSPRTIGAVEVRTVDEPLVAELLAHYGEGASLAMDSVWLLVLPERSPSPVQ